MDNIKDILRDVLKGIPEQAPQTHTRLERVWGQILDPGERRHTRISCFKQGRLIVDVDAPARIYALNMRKGRLLEKIQQEIPDVKNLYFKIGNV